MATIRKSAGILLYRRKNNVLEVLLVHPGGPFWAKKDTGAWSIPKGEFTEEEQPLTAAKREFLEETSFPVEGEFIELAPVTQKGGKVVYAWAVEGDLQAEAIKSNTYPVEWPPKSGKWLRVPEVDRAAWFPVEEAVVRINVAQARLVEELVEKLDSLSGALW